MNEISDTQLKMFYPQVLKTKDARSFVKKKLTARGYNWATLFLGEINTGTWPSRLGESKLETIKYVHESRETQI
jgi:hypothetical protein